MSSILRREYQRIEKRLLTATGNLVPLSAEVTYYTRKGIFLLPGYLSTLILLTASIGSRYGEACRRLAVIGELLIISVLFHNDINDRHSTVNGTGIEAYDALNILIGDAVIAKVYDLLNRLTDSISCEVSDAIVEHLENWLCRYLARPHVEHGDQWVEEVQEHIALFAGKMVKIVAGIGQYDPSLTGVLQAYAVHLTRALHITHDVWVDYQEYGFLDMPRAYLLRSGLYGLHVAWALRRGVNLQPYLDRLRQGMVDAHDVDRLLRLIVESGAVTEALHQARAQTFLALSALESAGREAEVGPLLVFARNIYRAIDHVESTVGC